MNILMIAYSFPPSSSSSTFRPMFFANHLHEMGEKIYVLTVRKQDYLADQPKDDKLLDSLEDTIEIVRSRVFRPREAVLRFRDRLFRNIGGRKAGRGSVQQSEMKNVHSGTSLIQEFKNIITDCLSTPDQQIGWLPSAVKQGTKMIKNYNIDILYATGGPWTSLLIGSILKKRTGRPLVIDFRDPWVANPSSSSDSKLIRSVQPWIERKVVTFADHIIANTEELRQDFLNRYPRLNASVITTIPNGFETFVDTDDFSNKEKLTFTHAGALYFSRNPKFLLQAVLNLVEQRSVPSEDLSLVFLGGIDTSIQDPVLENLINHPCLQDIIHILPRLPYHEAIQYQEQSDVLFLLQPDFPLQVPRKLYEYLAFRKPILGITDLCGATARIIQENNFGIVVENQTGAIESALRTFHKSWREKKLAILAETKNCDKFLNSHLTSLLHNIFRECLNS